MPATLATEFFTLNELVTLIGFGVARTPAEELASLRADQHQLSTQIDCVQAEASKAGDQCFAKLPVFPISALVERLEENREHWRQSAGKLYASAQSLIEKQRTYIARYQDALNRIFFRVAERHFDLVGRVDEHPSAPFAKIPPEYLHGAVTIGHNRADIGPAAYLRDLHPPAGSILRSGHGLSPIFFGVRTSRQVASQFDQSTPTLKARPPVSDSTIEDWYKRERTALPTPATREEDEKALHREFPEVVKVRQHVRHLRKTFLKTRRGRRPSSPR